MTEFSSNYQFQQPKAHVKLKGTEGNDEVKGESKFGILDIDTGGGNDNTTISGMGGLTMLDNAAGDDTNYIFNIFSNNKIVNGSGDDTNNIFSSFCDNKIYNGSGDDKNILGGSGNINTVYNGSGNDVTFVQGNHNKSKVYGGSGNDTAYVSSQGHGNQTVISGGSGYDKVVFEGSPSQYQVQMVQENGQYYRQFTDANGNVTKVAGDVENIQFTQPYIAPQPQPQPVPQPAPQPQPIAPPPSNYDFLDTLANWFFQAMNAILSPPQPVAANEVGTITGDPHFKGGDGGKYDVQGEPGKSYNLLSDKGLQFNGRFDAWGGGGATVVGETGLSVSGPYGQSNVTFCKDGTAKVNGVELKEGQTVRLADGGIAKKEGNKLIVQTAEGYTITQSVHGSKHGNYINTEVKTGSQGVAADGVLPGGLLGQTFDPDNVAKNGKKGAGAQGEGAIAGKVQDYEVGSLTPPPYYQPIPQPQPVPMPYPVPIPYPFPEPMPLPIDGKIEIGTNANDRINGSNQDDILAGRGGNDVIRGRQGDDRIYGNAGNDRIYGGNGNDRVYGGAGNDRIYGGNGNDSLVGGAGNDRIYGGNGNDRVYGGAGNDYISGGKGNDVLVGGAGNDKIYGGKGNDVINGGAGNDEMYGGKGADRIYAGAGSDTVNAGEGNDTVIVNSRNQHGTTQKIYAGKGKDNVVVNAANGTDNTYKIKTGKGKDTVELNLSSGFKVERPNWAQRTFGGAPQYVVTDANGNRYELKDFNPNQDKLVINGQEIDPRKLV